MICKKCNTEKPLDSFPKTKGKYYRHVCKKCDNLRHKTGNYNIKFKRESILNLSDYYIIKLLKRQKMHLTSELMEIKRQLIILKRNIKNIQNDKM